MSRVRKDLTNQRFGRLVALYPTGEIDKHKNVLWHCKCDCGNEVDRPAALLPRLKSCGCGRIVTKDDLIGQKIGRLTVLEIVPTEGYCVRYRCVCECGAETIVTRGCLVSGSTRSCGCLRVETCARMGKDIDHKRRKDIAGMKFGRLTALYDTGTQDSYHNTIWHMKCDCDAELEVPLTYLTRGITRSCGCLRRDRMSQRNRGSKKKD